MKQKHESKLSYEAHNTVNLFSQTIYHKYYLHHPNKKRRQRRQQILLGREGGGGHAATNHIYSCSLFRSRQDSSAR